MTREILIEKIASAQAMLSEIYNFGVYSIKMDGVYMHSDEFMSHFDEYRLEETGNFRYPGALITEKDGVIIKCLLDPQKYLEFQERLEKSEIEKLKDEIEELKAEIKEMEQRHDEEIREIKEDYEEQIREYCVPVSHDHLLAISTRDFV